MFAVHLMTDTFSLQSIIIIMMIKSTTCCWFYEKQRP